MRLEEKLAALRREHKMTQAELALWELNLAQRELEEGRMELEASMAEHDQEKKRLEEKYIDSMDLTEKN